MAVHIERWTTLPDDALGYPSGERRAWAQYAGPGGNFLGYVSVKTPLGYRCAFDSDWVCWFESAWWVVSRFELSNPNSINNDELIEAIRRQRDKPQA